MALPVNTDLAIVTGWIATIGDNDLTCFLNASHPIRTFAIGLAGVFFWFYIAVISDTNRALTVVACSPLFAWGIAGFIRFSLADFVDTNLVLLAVCARIIGWMLGLALAIDTFLVFGIAFVA